MKLKTVIILVTLIAVLVSIAIFIKQQLRKEQIEGVTQTNPIVFLADEAKNLANKIVKGEETENAKEKQARKEEVKKLYGKTKELPNEAIQTKETLVQNAISEKGGDYLLVEKDTYSIVYVKTPDVFYVFLKNAPLDLYKLEAENWFIDKGFTKDDLCALGINYVLDSNLKRPIDFNNHPAHCQ